MTEPSPKSEAREEYYASLSEGQRILRSLYEAFAAAPSDDERRAALRAACLRIRASAEAHDCEILGKIAAEGERLTTEAASQAVLERLAGTIDAFDEEVRILTQDAEARRARVLVVDDDAVTNVMLRGILEREGFAVQTVSTAGEAEAMLELTPPDVAIVDLYLGTASGMELIDRRWPRFVPMIVISADASFETKLEAVRRGCAGYFAKPFDWEELVRKVRSVGSPAHDHRGSRVLIVEADNDQAIYLRRILDDAGHTTSICNDPMKVEERITSFNPNLILLDVDLGATSGHDIARYLRQQERYAAVPILFLTASRNADAEAQAIAAGGDDFLPKPVNADMLLTSIAARLERAARLKTMLERDPLTDLLTHRSLADRIGNAVAMKQRKPSQMYSLAMLDVDHFKEVNDRFGHLTGDRVLSSLGSFLMNHLRQTDVIGRYGGEEFGVILPVEPAPAVDVMRHLLREFSAVTHRSDDGVEFTISFTAGVAGLEIGMSADEWKLSADRALLDGKRKGRNRIVQAVIEEPMFDETVLDSLRQLEAKSGAPIITELTRFFLETLPQRLETLQRGIATHDAATIEHAAHALRSAAGNIGARQLAALCGELETVAGRGEIDAASLLVGNVVSESARVAAALRA